MESLLKQEQTTAKLKKSEKIIKNKKAYREELNPLLDASVKTADPYRVCWFVNYFSISSMLMLSLVAFKLTWEAQLVLGMLIGFFNAMVVNSVHEILHGGVIKDKRWQYAIGLIGFTSILTSVTFWNIWHNEMHHERTQQGRLDPLAWPSLDDYQKNKWQQKIFALTPGSGTRASYFFFFFWFSASMFIGQFYLRFKMKNITLRQHILISLENAVQIGVWAAALYLIPSSLWIFCLVVPFLVQNYFLSSYQMLEHSLMPITEENDVLVNTMSINNFPLNILHHFSGYNVEHYLYPEVPFSRLPKLKKIVMDKYKDKYKTLSKWKAIYLLYQTPRVYKNNKEFIHPETHKVVSLKE